MRLYGPRACGPFATAYVEIFRGTPVLLQLYVLYYRPGRRDLRSGPWSAAIIGLGLNYAAYEAEIYRGAHPGRSRRAQMEAALALGHAAGALALRRVILPQALRIALPGVTNDFIALLKDSSLVSVHHRRRADQADDDHRGRQPRLAGAGAAVRRALLRDELPLWAGWRGGSERGLGDAAP